MKRSSNWDEKSIEQQLKNLPKVEDKKSKDELFARIQERLQEEQIKQRPNKKTWFVPAVAAAAVFLLLLIIVPSFLNEKDISIDETNQLKTEMVKEELNDEELNKIATIETEPKMAADTSYPIYMGAVQPIEEVELANQLVKIAVPVSTSTGEYVVPITVIADGQNDIEKFQQASALFSGEVWGLGRFPSFLINSIKAEGEILQIDVPKGSLESLSSLETVIFGEAIKETFSPKYKEITWSTDGEPHVVLGELGPIEKLDLVENNSGYYLIETQTGHMLLIPGNRVGAPGNSVKDQISLEETLELMKQSSSGYRSSILEHIVITSVKQEGEEVTIEFADGTFFENDQLHLAMLEAILATARDFGFSYVKLEGVTPSQVGAYHTGDKLKPPNFINFIR